jgi:molecular chaperone DnaJ
MDLYVVLGLGRDATLGDIKRAYRRLARKFHPDINPGDRRAAVQFRRITEAYQTLSDPDRRRRYDATGIEHAPAAPPVAGFEGFDFSVSMTDASATTFGDLFGEMLRQRAERRRPERGQDLHHEVTLRFEDAMRGLTCPVTLTRLGRCQTCHGRGVLEVAEQHCASCQGSGVVRATRGHMVFTRPCAPCRGTGHRADARCPSCAGQQVERRTEVLHVHLPPGLTDGTRIRVGGQGHAGLHGGEPGDLYVTVHVAPHPLFQREQDDLHITVDVAVHEAALGAKVEVPSLDGSARLRIPPGTQGGQRFRIRERGVVSSHTGRRGDLVVEVRIVLPRTLDARSKALLEEFGRLNPEDVRQARAAVKHEDVR